MSLRGDYSIITKFNKVRHFHENPLAHVKFKGNNYIKENNQYKQKFRRIKCLKEDKIQNGKGK